MFNQKNIQLCPDTETHRQIVALNRQTVALLSIMAAIFLSIVTISKSKNIILADKIEPSKSDLYYIDKLPKISISIILLASFFFLFESYKTYRVDECNQDSKNYIIANIFSFIATYIRFTAIFSSDIYNPEEIDF